MNAVLCGILCDGTRKKNNHRDYGFLSEEPSGAYHKRRKKSVTKIEKEREKNRKITGDTKSGWEKRQPNDEVEITGFFEPTGNYAWYLILLMV